MHTHTYTNKVPQYLSLHGHELGVTEHEFKTDTSYISWSHLLIY